MGKFKKTAEEQVLRGVEVATLLGRSMGTVYQLVKDGRLPRPRQLGRGSFWLRSEVIDCMRAIPVRRPRRQKGGIEP